MTFEEQLAVADGHRFQKELGEFIIANNCEVVVETGLGVSTLFILDALDKLGKGHLYSIDPAPWYSLEIVHPRLTHIKEKSIPSLLSLYKTAGAWDLMVSDGNHEILSQTYEYQFGLYCLKANGWLCADDTNWNNNGAWNKFLDNNNVTVKPKIGSLDVVQKTSDDAMNVMVADEIHAFCLSRAQTREKIWLENGGIIAEYFKD